MAAVLSNLSSILIAVFIINFSQSSRQFRRRLSVIYVGRDVWYRKFFRQPSVFFENFWCISYKLFANTFASKSLDMPTLTASSLGLFTLGMSLTLWIVRFKKEMLPRVALIILIKFFSYPLFTAICVYFFPWEVFMIFGTSAHWLWLFNP